MKNETVSNKTDLLHKNVENYIFCLIKIKIVYILQSFC